MFEFHNQRLKLLALTSLTNLQMPYFSIRRMYHFPDSIFCLFCVNEMLRQVYHVEMKDAGRSWDVYRRYTEFCRLHAVLKKQVTDFTFHFLIFFISN